MESIGEKLKSARETNGFSIEQVARDTHIAKRFLQALEDENFSVFPGEPYLLGFLKSYSRYVGLNADDIINLYKNIKLQEQPAPIVELLEKKNPVPLVAIGIIVLVAVLGAGGYFGFRFLQENGGIKFSLPQRKPAVEKPAAQEYSLTDEVFEQKFRPGDSIVISLNDQSYRLTVGFEKDAMLLDAPEGQLRLTQQEERAIDLDGNDQADVKVLFRGIDSTGTESMLVVRFDRLAQVAQEAPVAGLPALDEARLGTTSDPSRILDPVSIYEAAKPEPFTVEIAFHGSTLFRYFVDQEVREERYFKKQETFSISARNEVQLWASNAGAMSVKVSGREVSLGVPGEVSTKLIRWVKSDTGIYRLRLLPVY